MAVALWFRKSNAAPSTSPMRVRDMPIVRGSNPRAGPKKGSFCTEPSERAVAGLRAPRCAMARDRVVSGWSAG